MGRNVEDVARLLSVQAGVNPEVPFGRQPADFASLLTADMKGKRIAWLGDWGGAYQIEPGILDLCETALQVFTDLGAQVEAIAPPFPAAQLWQAWTTLRAMLNAGGMKALYDDPAKRAQIKPESIWEIEQGRGRMTYAIMATIMPEDAWAMLWLIQGSVMLFSLFSGARNCKLMVMDAVLGVFLWTVCVISSFVVYWPAMDFAAAVMQYKPPAAMAGEVGMVLASWWVLIRYQCGMESHDRKNRQ